MNTLQSAEKSFYKSKKFWTAVSTVALMLLNDVLKWGLSESAVNSVLATAAIYMASQGLADLGKNNLNKVKDIVDNAATSKVES